MKVETLKGNDLRSEPTDKPVRVIEPDGKTFREEPCLFRKRGLAVWKAPIKSMSQDEALEAGWTSMWCFSVTHEPSGAGVCYFPTQDEAVGALFCALTITDWTKDMAAVKNAVERDPRKLDLIHALKQGRLEIVRIGDFPQAKAGVA